MTLVQKIFFRSAILLVIAIAVFRIEYWPLSYYPVFSDKKDSSEYVVYNFVIEKNNGRKITPLSKGLSRRILIYMLHEEDKDFKGVGELNLRAAISFLKQQYYGLDYYSYKRHVTDIAKAYIVREHYKKNSSGGYDLQDERIIYEVDQRGFDEIFL